MKKRMKIIDIFCLISNGEKVPKKIRVEGVETFIFRNGKYEHEAHLGEDNSSLGHYFALDGMLNSEVEILDEEDDEDIPLIPDDELYIIGNNLGNVCKKPIEEQLDYNFKILQEKINQVVEGFNKYRKEVKENE